MSYEEEEPLTDREKRYLKRIHKKKFDYTNDNEDKGKAPVSGSEEEEKDFPKILLRAMQDISREIKELRMDIIKESPKGFHIGEGSGMSHHWNDQLVHQPQFSQSCTMPAFLAAGNEGFQEHESLEDYFEEYESQNQRFKDNLNFQEFCHIKDKRRPGHHHRGGGFIQNHDQHHSMGILFLPKFDGSSKCSTKPWVEKIYI